MATGYNNITVCAKLCTIAGAISRLTKYLVSLQAMCIDAKTITYFVGSYFIFYIKNYRRWYRHTSNIYFSHCAENKNRKCLYL